MHFLRCWVLLWLALGGPAGCDWLTARRGLSATPKAEAYTVKAGDSLSLIGQEYGVSVAELKAWNGLTGDLIEVDQVLMIRRADLPSLRFVLQPRAGRPTRAPARGARGGARGTSGEGAVASAAEIGGEGDAEAPADGPGGVVIERPSPFGVLGVQLGGADSEELARSAQAIERFDHDLGEHTSLSTRSGMLAQGGTAETLEIRMPDRGGPGVADGTVTRPALRMPQAKRCLGGPSQVVGESGMVTSRGLTVSEIKASMNAVSRHAKSCFPAGTRGVYDVTAWVVAGCDGRVSSVEIERDGGLPASVTSCVAYTLRHADLPAHALPDGQEFLMPLRFSL